MPGGLNVDAASSRAALVSGRFPEPVPIHSPIWYLTRDTLKFFNLDKCILQLSKLSENSKPVLLWSYCWKPKIRSERWVNNFSFRALSAEPSAALTLWTHRPRCIIYIHVFCLVSVSVNPDMRCTSVSEWVCAWNGWLDTGRSGASVLCPLWCRHLGCSPPRSNLTLKKLW